jgi:acyl carrier protein
MHESTGGSSIVTTQERLADLLVSKYGVERATLVPEASMAALGLDSLSLAELMFDIEDAFGITLKQEGTELRTFGDAVGLIDAARAGHSEPAG